MKTKSKCDKEYETDYKMSNSDRVNMIEKLKKECAV
jgi:hypothetical protein